MPPFSRRRRTTFSTSMMASSTSAPTAIAIPPSVMVLMLAPSAAHGEDRGHERERDGENGDPGRADAREEEEHDRDHQDGAVAQRADDVPDSDLDEVGLPEDIPVDLHPLGEGLLDRVELCVEPLRQLERVRARLLLDAEDHRGTAVVRALAQLHRRADPHLAELADQHGLGAAHGDHGLADVGRRADPADAVDEHTAVRPPRRSPRRCSRSWRGAPEPPRPRSRRYAESRSGRRMTWYCLVSPPVGIDLRDAGHGEEAAADRPVGRRLQVHRRVAVRRQRDEEDLAHDRGHRREDRSVRAGRQRRLRELQLLRDDLARLVDVGAPLELDPDDRDADPARGPNPADAGRAVQRRLDGEGDLALDLLRRHPVRLGDHRHGGCGEVGEDVHGHADRDDRAPGEEDPRPEEDDEPVVKGPADDGVDHRGSL